MNIFPQIIIIASLFYLYKMVRGIYMNIEESIRSESVDFFVRMYEARHQQGNVSYLGCVVQEYKGLLGKQEKEYWVGESLTGDNKPKLIGCRENAILFESYGVGFGLASLFLLDLKEEHLKASKKKFNKVVSLKKIEII